MGNFIKQFSTYANSNAASTATQLNMETKNGFLDESQSIGESSTRIDWDYLVDWFQTIDWLWITTKVTLDFPLLCDSMETERRFHGELIRSGVAIKFHLDLSLLCDSIETKRRFYSEMSRSGAAIKFSQAGCRH